VHVLTKILVALTAVASVALATLTMAYAVNADRVLGELRAQKAATAAAKAQLDLQSSAFSNQIAALQDLNSELNNKLNEALNEQRELQVMITKLEGEKAEAERARAAILGEISNLSSSAQTLAALTSKLTDENDDLRDRYVRQNEELIELADKLNEAESQRAVLDATVRQLELQLRELQNAGALGGRSLGSLGGGETIVQGQIRDVTVEPDTNLTLVEVTLGQNDGIAPGTELRAVRGGEWVANLRTTKVDLNRSAAVVTLVRQGASVLPGDQVEVK